MNVPKISVITVGMGHLRFLKDLLPSLYSQSFPPDFGEIEMIYVDNCSTDGSVEFIKKNYPQVTIIQNHKVRGFGENNNKGVMASHGEYIAIINPDIVFQKNSLLELYNYAESHKEVGIVAPELLNADGSHQFSIRRYISVGKLFARALTIGRDSSKSKRICEYLYKDIDPSQTHEVDWAMGAALFMKREMYAELGGFDTDYFLYMEDEDICKRSWSLNRPVVYCPKSVMIHNHQRASWKLGKNTYHHVHSMLTFFRRYGLSPKR